MIDMEFKHYNLPNVSEQPVNNQDYVVSPNTFRLDRNLIVKDFFASNDVETYMLRGQRIGRKSVNANYSIGVVDYLIGVTSLAIAPTLGLPNPAIAGIGKTFRVKDEVGGALTTTITVISEGEKTIDGAATSTIITNYGSKSYYTDGANWFTY